MATMVAYTTLELTKEQKSALCAAVEKGASEAFNIDISITHHSPPVSQSQCKGADHLLCLYGSDQDRRSKAPVGKKSV